MSSLEDFLFISFQQKNEMKKGKYPDGVRYLLFCSSNDLFDVKDFKKHLTREIFLWESFAREKFLGGEHLTSSSTKTA